MKILSWLVCGVLTVLGWILFSGCTPVVETVYVHVPCAPVLERPMESGEAVQSVIDIIGYTRKLEYALDACR